MNTTSLTVNAVMFQIKGWEKTIWGVKITSFFFPCLIENYSKKTTNACSGII